MPSLRFYDVKAKTSFRTDKFKLTMTRKNGRTTYFAKAKSPKSGIMSWRIIAKDFYLKYGKLKKYR